MSNLATPGSEGEGSTWQRIPGETTKDWIVSPEGHRIPLGGDIDKILVYLNALTSKAAKYDEAVEALKWIAERESWPNWRLAHYAYGTLSSLSPEVKP